MGAFSGAHAADDGRMLHLLGQLREVLTNLNPRHGRRDRLVVAAVFRVRLHVKGILVAGAAVHPEQDTRPVFAAAAGRVGRHHVEPAR